MKMLCGVLVILLYSSAAWAGNFTDNQNGTVADNTTGLVWQQQDDPIAKSWEAAISYCEGLSLAGHVDWRLPNINELDSIIDRDRYSPAIDQVAFTNTTSSNYWSSTADAGYTEGAWIVGFFYGDVASASKSYIMSARCVRGGQ